MKPSDVKDGRITGTQGKTKKSFNVPILPDLQHILDLHRQRAQQQTVVPLNLNDLPVLHTTFGKGYSDNGFGEWFHRRVSEAGLKTHPEGGVSFHGLRKNACNVLSEAGCTTHEISAITRQSLKIVEHYTQRADQRLLAKSAMTKLAKHLNRAQDQGETDHAQE